MADLDGPGSRWARLPEPLPIVSSMPPELAQAFALLRRPQVESDRLPDEQHRVIEGPMGRRGLNPELARRATTEVGDVWVVPGNGFVCHIDDGGAGCCPTRLAAAGQMVSWGSTNSPGRTFVHGLIPDGVPEVTVVAENGPSRTLPVHENLYGAFLDGFSSLSVSFTGPSGKVVIGPWS